LSATFPGGGGGLLPLFDIANAVVEDLPNEATEAVRDDPDCPVVVGRGRNLRKRD